MAARVDLDGNHPFDPVEAAVVRCNKPDRVTVPVIERLACHVGCEDEMLRCLDWEAA